MSGLKTPVCLFTWKRWDSLERIFKVLSVVKPQKIYLCSDGGRNSQEWELIKEVRKKIDDSITWDCEKEYMYSNKNIGVFESIGMGALSIFKKEETCIFLEDDNLPTVSFFKYCEECLEKYRYDEKVLMVCGTNYLKKGSKTHNSYMFVRALLPCGWASWSNKFIKYYDKDLSFFDEQENINNFLKKYSNKALASQQLASILAERKRYLNNERFRSWDYHLIASIMNNDLLVISPKYNQITNIGVDDFGIHNSKNYKKNPMTKRFCEIKSTELVFPLTHPKTISIDKKYQRKLDKIITLPWYLILKSKLVKILKKAKIIK